MKLSQLLYSKEALSAIEPFSKLRANPNLIIKPTTTTNHINVKTSHRTHGTNLILSKLPVVFTNSSYEPSSISFLDKYRIPKVYKQLFEQAINPFEKSPFIEPKLLSHMMSPLTPKLLVEEIEIKSMRIMNTCQIYGVFIHRKLNLKEECYSFEKKEENKIYARMRTKFLKSTHIQDYMSAKEVYNSTDMHIFYMDGYDNFAKTEYISRVLIQVDAVIKGKAVYKGKEMELGNENPVTRHLMQVERVHVSRPDIEQYMVTDLDYLLQGNDYFE